jgi:hypothetical protein
MSLHRPGAVLYLEPDVTSLVPLSKRPCLRFPQFHSGHPAHPRRVSSFSHRCHPTRLSRIRQRPVRRQGCERAPREIVQLERSTTNGQLRALASGRNSAARFVPCAANHPCSHRPFVRRFRFLVPANFRLPEATRVLRGRPLRAHLTLRCRTGRAGRTIRMSAKSCIVGEEASSERF